MPYVGDILLLQEGMSAGLFLTPTDHAHAGPTTKAARADVRLTPHIHRWWLPPPEATNRCRVRCTAGTVVYVPFVNRPFESEIHGTVNFTQFCCVLLVTWCYRVLLSCYLRPK